MQNRINLIDDRRFDAELSRTFESASRSRDSFCHRFHAPSDFCQAFPSSQLLAKLAIPAVATKTSRDEIPYSAQALEGSRVAAHAHSESNELGH